MVQPIYTILINKKPDIFMTGLYLFNRIFTSAIYSGVIFRVWASV